MRKYLESLVRDLGTEFAKIDTRDDSSLNRTRAKLTATTKALEQLHLTIESHPFKSQEDEIAYFKELKPSIHRLHLFYQSVERIESTLPIGLKGSVRSCLKKEQKSLTNFFERNRDKFEYVRRGSTYRDHIYFVSSSAERHFVAGVLAAEMLDTYLKERILSLKQKARHEDSNLGSKKVPVLRNQKNLFQTKWTGTKTELVELMYALHANGSINGGKGTIKSIAEAFEIFLDTNLSDYRFTYKEIKNRYRPDKFLGKLSVALTQKVQDELE